MSKLLLSSLVLVLVVSLAPARRCTCKEAGERDVPHGANEHLEEGETTVKSLRGRVVYNHDDSPVDEAVVEVFQLTPEDKKLKTYDIVQRRERRVACVTSKDGSFCFADLPSGRYIVRAGTLSRHAGMNYNHITVNLDRRWWSRWFRSEKGITLELRIGT